MQENIIRCLAAALAVAALPSGAVGLGDARAVSALGEPLDVRIPVAVAQGEALEGACFSLARETPGDLPRLGAARLALERSAQGATLRVRTSLPVDEPAFALTIRIACPGQSAESRRDYSVLLDPRPMQAGAPKPAAAPASASAPAPSGFAAAVATLIARIGDTLESIARAIFPRNRAARTAYVTALREQNPSLSALRPDEQIPVDSAIALPDLRTFAHRHAAPATQLAESPPPRAAAKARGPAPREAVAERATAAPARAPAPAPANVAEGAPARAPARASAPPRAHPEFVLKLSGGEVDLARSRGVDDRTRAQLRERLQLLDNDDQVAALLRLQHSVKQLEARVADLQLKLAGMPASFPAPRAEPAKPAAPAAATVEAPKVEAPKVAEAPKVEAPKVAEAPKVEAPKTVEAPKVEAPSVAVTPVPATSESTATAAKGEAPVDAPKAAAKPAPRALPVDSGSSWLSEALWFVGAFLVMLALLLAWRLARRRRADAEFEEVEAAEPPLEDELPHVEPAAPVDERKEPVFSAATQAALQTAAAAKAPPAAPVAPAAPALAPAVAARVSETDTVRRRYLDERFPEVARGAIRLEEPKSVIKAARLFYEDGAIARAIELLHFAIETKPEEIRLWLALFEIFRLERLRGEYAELARRFQARHGTTEAWRKVQYFGREIDAGNMLYQDEAFKSLETIGPAGARRAQQAKFDPLAENWLDVPGDFENEALANELRKALMTHAAVQEQDLLPNPMPALRSATRFSAA